MNGYAELSDQLVDGAAEIIANAVRRRPLRTARLASELTFLACELLEGRVPTVRRSVNFWRRVRKKLIAEHAADLTARLAEDSHIAYCYGRGTHNVERILEDHGLAAVFEPFDAMLQSRMHGPLAERVFVSTFCNDRVPGTAVHQLVQLGKAVRGASVPWIPDAKRLLAYHRVSQQEIHDVRVVAPRLPPEAWLGAWAVTAVATEAQEASRRRSPRLALRYPRSGAMVDEVTPLGALMEIADHRKQLATMSLRKALAAVPFAPDDAVVVGEWTRGNADVIGIPE